MNKQTKSLNQMRNELHQLESDDKVGYLWENIITFVSEHEDPTSLKPQGLATLVGFALDRTVGFIQSRYESDGMVGHLPNWVIIARWVAAQCNPRLPSLERVFFIICEDEVKASEARDFFEKHYGEHPLF